MDTIIIIYLAIINVGAFVVYGLDKYKAQHAQWRIKERTLLAMAWAGGALGAFVAMQTFRHKTQHDNFNIQVPIAMFAWAAILYLMMP